MDPEWLCELVSRKPAYLFSDNLTLPGMLGHIDKSYA